MIREAMKRAELVGTPWWVHGLAWGGLALGLVFCAVLLWSHGDVDVWAGFEPSGELHTPVYAERVFVASVFRTRVNTYSNLFYVFAGLYVFGLALWDARRPRSARKSYATQSLGLMVMYGFACCYLGVGSGIFHASLTRWGQQLDVAAMYSPLVVLLALHWARWLPALPSAQKGLPTWPLFAVAAAIACALLYVYKWELSSTRVMLVLVGAIGVSGLWDAATPRFSMDYRWLFLGAAALLGGYVVRQIDVEGNFSGPDAWYQGHSLWHLLTAAGLFCMACFYRSERGREEVA